MTPNNSVRDTAGPMARSVADMTILLDVIVGPDPEDPVTARADGHRLPTYTAQLKPDALRVRASACCARCSARRSPIRKIIAQFETTLAELKAAGAEIVDPFVGAGDSTCGARAPPRPRARFKDDLTTWIAKHPGVPFPSVKAIAEFQAGHPLHQALLDEAAAAKPVDEDPGYNRGPQERAALPRRLHGGDGRRADRRA